MYQNFKLGFIGLGQMGSAIARGLLQKHPDLRLYVSDPILIKNNRKNKSNQSLLERDWLDRVSILSSNVEVEKNSDIILLCVKPQVMPDVFTTLTGNKRYISIAAGLSVERIAQGLGLDSQQNIARVMPNISALIGKSVSGIYAINKDLRKITESIFNDLGFALSFPKEELLHAVTGLSGSGPAFVFSFIAALAEGGVLSGLPYPDALQLAVHTVIGSAEMLLSTGSHPSEFRNKVTSAGGTTIAGISKLEESRFHFAVMDAVKAATERSHELGE